MKIYLVRGMNGEYSDRVEWVSCAFLDYEKAKTKVEELSKRTRIAKLEYDKKIKEINERMGFPPNYQTTYKDQELIKEHVKIRDSIFQWMKEADPGIIRPSFDDPWNSKYWIEETELIDELVGKHEKRYYFRLKNGPYPHAIYAENKKQAKEKVKRMLGVNRLPSGSKLWPYKPGMEYLVATWPLSLDPPNFKKLMEEINFHLEKIIKNLK